MQIGLSKHRMTNMSHFRLTELNRWTLAHSLQQRLCKTEVAHLSWTVRDATEKPEQIKGQTF